MKKHEACIRTNYGWVELNHNIKYCVNCITNINHDKILQSNFYKSKENIYWPKITKIYNYKSNLKGETNIISYYETEYISNILRYPEFTPIQFKEALLFLCEVCQYCNDNNYWLRTHLWNVTFYRGKPYLLDIRDFEILKNQSWKTIFIGHFKEELDNHCPISAKKFVNNYKYILDNLNKCCDNLNDIKNIINEIDIISHSNDKWSDYHNNRCKFLYDSQQFDKTSYNKIKLFKGGSNSELKSLNLFNFIENIKPKSMIEIGCNNGLYTFGASNFGPSIGLDYDKKSIDEANNLNKKLKRDVNFLYIDVLNDKQLNINYGLNGCYGNTKDRFKSELLIAPAIIHHLFDQCKSTDKIINIFNSFAEKYMIIEQIPNTVSENNLKKSLDMYNWKIIDESPSCPHPRKWLLCNKIE